MKYYNLLKVWHLREENDFEFANSHKGTGPVREASADAVLVDYDDLPRRRLWVYSQDV